jgi:CheY-like chemotaxis protein
LVALPLNVTPDNIGSFRLPAFESLSAAVIASKRAGSPQAAKTKSSSPRAAQRTSPTEAPLLPRNACVHGRFHILIVDDEKVGRKMLSRRFARLFPYAEIDEVKSGEDALRVVEDMSYDIITMDHFMAVDEMNGDETIQALRERNVDSCIIGISGNLKEVEHKAAGAQDFFQKPLPSDEVILNRLLPKLAPPSGWKVLCVDDVEMNLRFLRRKLHRVSAPHFTNLHEAEKVSFDSVSCSLYSLSSFSHDVRCTEISIAVDNNIGLFGRGCYAALSTRTV